MGLPIDSLSHPLSLALLHINFLLYNCPLFGTWYIGPQGPFLVWFQETTIPNKCWIIIKWHLASSLIRGGRHPVVALRRDCTFPKTRVPLPACRMWCRKRGFATLALSSPRVTGSTVKGAPSALKHRWHWGEESSTPSSAINLSMTSNELFNLSRLLLFIGVKAACKTSCLTILIEVGFCGYFTSFLSLLSISSSNVSFLLFPPLLPSPARALAVPISSACVVLAGVGGAVMWDNCCQMGAEGEQWPLGRPGQAGLRTVPPAKGTALATQLYSSERFFFTASQDGKFCG